MTKWDAAMESLPWLALWSLVAAVLVFASVALVKCATADGRADFCYVGLSGTSGAQAVTYEVQAHRPWRPDLTISYHHDLAEAVAAARLAGCGMLYTEKP